MMAVSIEQFINHKPLVQTSHVKHFIQDNNFNILHVNVRSLSDKFNEFSIMLADLDINFSCIVVSETWFLENDFLDQYFIKGFNFFCCSRKAGMPRGGGVCI